jgi:DNA-binding XRE family transcriptional regulator
MNGSEMKEIRKHLGLIQADLGRVLDLTRVSIGLMERGDTAIDARTRLAMYYLRDNPSILSALKD